jgi:hypothetical protein
MQNFSTVFKLDESCIKIGKKKCADDAGEFKSRAKKNNDEIAARACRPSDIDSFDSFTRTLT